MMVFNLPASVQTANRLILALLLFSLLSIFLEPLPEGLEIFLAASGTTVLLGILFRQTVREFCQDSRFRTLPRWHSAVMLAGLALAITLGLIIFILSFLNWLFPQYLENLEAVTLEEEASGTVDRLLEFVAVTVIVPVCEEFVFRGVALRAYETRSPLFAASLTAIVFALVHGDLHRLIAFIPSSFILARAVQRKGSWWLALIAHAVYNTVLVGPLPLLIPEAGIDGAVAVLVGVLGLAIAGVAFAIAVSWLKAFAVEVPTSDPKARIWTPALKTVVIIGTVAFSLTTAFLLS